MDVRIQSEEIDILSLIEKTKRENAGAVVTFQGTVRRYTDKSEVQSLIYESYTEMALEILRSIVEGAAKKYGLLDANVIHRTGNIHIMEDSVAICVSSVHRRDAFKACEYIIDEIKKRAPIWKKDVYPEGNTMWHD